MNWLKLAFIPGLGPCQDMPCRIMPITSCGENITPVVIDSTT